MMGTVLAHVFTETIFMYSKHDKKLLAVFVPVYQVNMYMHIFFKTFNYLLRSIEQLFCQVNKFSHSFLKCVL